MEKEGLSAICETSGIELSYALGCSATAPEYYAEAGTQADLSFDPDSFTVKVFVTNTGARDSVETVQVYVHDCVRSVLAPVKSLAAFTKVSLAAGETKSVEIPVEPGAFSTVLPDETRVIEPGEFIVMAGHSSKDEDLLKVSVTF